MNGEESCCLLVQGVGAPSQMEKQRPMVEQEHPGSCEMRGCRAVCSPLTKCGRDSG